MSLCRLRTARFPIQQEAPRPVWDLADVGQVNDRIVEHESKANKRLRLPRRRWAVGKLLGLPHLGWRREVDAVMDWEGLDVYPADVERGFVIDDIPYESRTESKLALTLARGKRQGTSLTRLLRRWLVSCRRGRENSQRRYRTSVGSGRWVSQCLGGDTIPSGRPSRNTRLRLSNHVSSSSQSH